MAAMYSALTYDRVFEWGWGFGGGFLVFVDDLLLLRVKNCFWISFFVVCNDGCMC